MQELSSKASIQNLNSEGSDSQISSTGANASRWTTLTTDVDGDHSGHSGSESDATVTASVKSAAQSKPKSKSTTKSNFAAESEIDDDKLESCWPVWLVFSNGTVKDTGKAQRVYGRHAFELFHELENPRIEHRLPPGTSA